MIFDYIVIGKGLIGSAAFRYLSEASAQTLLIGPDEPADPTNHDGVFGAHYDEARLTHLHGKSPVWGELCRRSISRYRALEAASGISFYEPVGELFVADPGIESTYHEEENIVNSRRELGVKLARLAPAEQKAHFPFLAFPAASQVLWEQEPAGRINPRAMLRAQVAVGQAAGGQAVAELASIIEADGDHLAVTTREGRRYTGRQVLLATGSFANGFNLLPRPLALTCKTEMVVFGQVPASEAERLAAMPVVHYDLNSDTLANIYMIQPIRYPDGHYYIKLGANTVADQFLDSVAAMQAWYARGNSDQMKNALRRAVEQLVPGLEVLAWHTGRCVITRTPHTFPMIGAVIPGRLYVAVGGNGSSAAPADGLGELAANLVIQQSWTDPLPADQFAVSYAES